MKDMAAMLEPHIPALRRYAWALLRDHDRADDLVQDCLERSLSRWHGRRRDGDVRAWLFTILHNLFIDDARRRRREGFRVEIDRADDVAAAEPHPDDRLAARDVLARLDALPADHRAVLLLVGVEDLSYEETARVLGVPLGTVMSRLSRARDRLRRATEAPREPTLLRRVK